MPKVLQYITAYFTWVFLFYGTDVNENRAHVHVGKRGVDKFCKIWYTIGTYSPIAYHTSFAPSLSSM